MGLYTIFLLHTHYRKPYFFPGFPCFFTVFHVFSGFPGVAVASNTAKISRYFPGFFQGCRICTVTVAGLLWLQLQRSVYSIYSADTILFRYYI